MKKNIIKFGVGVVGIAVLGVAVFYGVSWYQYRNSPEYTQKLEYQKLVEAYKNDTYGGDTPEETLQLFIDALKAGDTDLAAKYFVLDEQEKWRGKLGNLEEKNVLNSMISDLSLAQRGNDISEDSARFIISNKNSEVITILNIGRSLNGKWKIIEL